MFRHKVLIQKYQILRQTPHFGDFGAKVKLLSAHNLFHQKFAADKKLQLPPLLFQARMLLLVE